MLWVEMWERATYQTGHINAVLLVATAHGKVLIDAVELGLGVALWNGVEELDVVEDVVVKGEVVGRDDVNAGVLLDLPVRQSESLALLEQLLLAELASPVGLVCLLEVPKDAHAGETQDG
jgi:hypothetical protein